MPARLLGEYRAHQFRHGARSADGKTAPNATTVPDCAYRDPAVSSATDAPYDTPSRPDARHVPATPAGIVDHLPRDRCASNAPKEMCLPVDEPVAAQVEHAAQR